MTFFLENRYVMFPINGLFHAYYTILPVLYFDAHKSNQKLLNTTSDLCLGSRGEIYDFKVKNPYLLKITTYSVQTKKEFSF